MKTSKNNIKIEMDIKDIFAIIVILLLIILFGPLLLLLGGIILFVWLIQKHFK